MARTHRLKTWPSFWLAIENGDKTFEVRRNDRDYAVGDILHLLYWDPAEEAFAFRETPHRWVRCTESVAETLKLRVTYVMQGGKWGIDPAVCVLGFRRCGSNGE